MYKHTRRGFAVEITNMKCRHENGAIHLTFAWPQGITQVYVNDVLYTLAEYKARGGYTAAAQPGVNTFTVCPFTREGGEDVRHAPPDGSNMISCVVTTDICIIVKKTRKLYINFLCTFLASHAVPAGVVTYTAGGQCFTFDEPLPAGVAVVRIIRSDNDVRFHIAAEQNGLYNLEVV
jgi:hypothetical protein